MSHALVSKITSQIQVMDACQIFSSARNYLELYGFVNLMPLAGCDCQHDNIYMSKKIVCSLLR